MLLAAVYIVIAAALAQWVAGGGPGWINVLVLVSLWNALKFIINGVVTSVRLMRVRAGERRYRDLTAPDEGNGMAGVLTES